MIRRNPRSGSWLLIGIILLALTACAAPKPPAGDALIVGQPYAITVFTHCGFHTADVAGQTWSVISGPTGDGANAPPGMEDIDHGTFTLEGADQARYRSDRGPEFTLTRGGQRLEGCL